MDIYEQSVAELSSSLKEQNDRIEYNHVFDWMFFLDGLWQRGEVNMRHSSPYLQNHVAREFEYRITDSIAKKIVYYWINHYGERQLWLEANEDVKYADEP